MSDLRLAPDWPGEVFHGYRFPTSVFVLLRDLIVERTGVFYDDAKRGLLADKIVDVVAERGLASFLDYYYLLRYDDATGCRWSELADRLAVPETFFWRQADQFESLARVVAPAHFAANRHSALRIWSAACCSGEEPLSIAMALAETGLLEERPITIVGSDASPAMIARARAGRYGPRSFRQLPERMRDRYFVANGDGTWSPRPSIASLIEWRVANLVRPEDTADLETSDVVFCRNVFIYFSDDAVKRVVDRLAARMPPAGHLFLGASESLTRLGVDLELAEVGGSFVYVKPEDRR